jgi:hypothetical protein
MCWQSKALSAIAFRHERCHQNLVNGRLAETCRRRRVPTKAGRYRRPTASVAVDVSRDYRRVVVVVVTTWW